MVSKTDTDTKRTNRLLSKDEGDGLNSNRNSSLETFLAKERVCGYVYVFIAFHHARLSVYVASVDISPPQMVNAALNKVFEAKRSVMSRFRAGVS